MKLPKSMILSAPEEYIKRKDREEYEVSRYRNQFDRDRDRILFSKAFRRLKGKTQVFLSIGTDYIRTRLTHTLEVSQIARIVANKLKLNYTLTEAIALGHDLGHTPFGHIGERTLNQIMNNCDALGDFQEHMRPDDKGFKHNWQGLRVACDLEQLYGRAGLNLSNFTLWGILNHTRLDWVHCHNYTEDQKKNCLLLRNPQTCRQERNKGSYLRDFYNKYKQYTETVDGCPAWSFEGYIVRMADDIAQRHHDIEDALNLGVIDKDELIGVLEKNFRDFFSDNSKSSVTYRKIFGKLKESKDITESLTYLTSFIVNFYMNLLIENSFGNITTFVQNQSLYRRADFVARFPSFLEDHVKNVIGYPAEFQDRDNALQNFLRNRILNSCKAQQMDGKGRYILRKLCKAYITNPRQLYDTTILAVFKNYSDQDRNTDEYIMQKIGELRDQIDSAAHKSDYLFQIALLRSICDYISGMSDEFAIVQYKQLYG